MWWLYVLVVIALLVAAWAITRAWARRRSNPPDIEGWIANQSAAAEARRQDAEFRARRGDQRPSGP